MQVFHKNAEFVNDKICEESAFLTAKINFL